MKCSVCGAENNDTAKFCKTCGNPLKQETVQTTYSPPVNSNSNSNKKLILICVTAIICIAIVAAAFIMISNDGGNSGANHYVNTPAVSDSSSNSASSSSSSSSSSSTIQSSPNIYIKFCDFYAGSSASDKQYCSANIGTEHYGETYKIGVQYYSGNSRLNDGATATKTVDGEGFLHIYTSNSFSYYPDKAVVTIYDAYGNFLTEETYYLQTVSGQQKFGH